jgi:ADP-ribosylglycohydrolase
MFGAIIGDIVGSPYEFNQIKTTDFPFWTEGCHPTDDSVLTIATADAILRKVPYEVMYRQYTMRYPWGGYGERFFKWARDPEALPVDSFGNGSAMRVSPIAWAFDEYEIVKTEARKSALITHGHAEGIKGAQAVALCIVDGRFLSSKSNMYQIMKLEFGYAVDTPVDELRKHYRFDETCPGTVPQSFRCVYEAHSFEEAIRLAVSLGGDSDTVAAIAGSMAETLWPIPPEMIEKAMLLLEEYYPDITDTIMLWSDTYGEEE